MLLSRQRFSSQATAAAAAWSTIKLEVDENKFATMVLNRPEAHNAFNTEMIQEMHQCVSSLVGSNGEPKVRALFVTASGKTFCAGGDLKSMKQLGAQGSSEDNNKKDALALSTFLHTLNRAPFPTIALVQGNAFGGGVGLTSVCDIAVSVSTALFGLTEVKLGLIPATISPYVVQRIGQAQSRRYFITAERFDSNTAQRIGLLHEVCDGEQGLQEWKQKLQSQIKANSPSAIAASKDLISFLGENSTNHALVMEETANRLAIQRRSPEAQQGIQAFLDKQPAVWKI